MRAKIVVALSTILLFMSLGCGKKSEQGALPPTEEPQQQQQQVAEQPAQAPAPAPVVPAAVKEPEPQPLVIPAGTTLTVRLGTALSSKSSKPGETFPATISSPIKVGGKTAIPAGADATGQVLDAKKQGAFKGEAALAFNLTSVTVNGHTYQVETQPFMQQVKGKGKRTAKAIGGGTAGGAIIGAIAGGGKGAAIGAAVGAVGGTAVAGATGGENVNLPAEALVSFKLTNSVTIQPR